MVLRSFSEEGLFTGLDIYTTLGLRMALSMYYVYILRSVGNPSQTYIGSSSDLRKRLESHNSGANKHTGKFKPWKVIWYSAFETQEKAENFEKYLKSASGIAFRRKRLV